MAPARPGVIVSTFRTSTLDCAMDTQLTGSAAEQFMTIASAFTLMWSKAADPARPWSSSFQTRAYLVRGLTFLSQMSCCHMMWWGHSRTCPQLIEMTANHDLPAHGPPGLARCKMIDRIPFLSHFPGFYYNENWKVSRCRLVDLYIQMQPYGDSTCSYHT